MATWMPEAPGAAKRREYVFLACRNDLPPAKCVSLCEQWRAGSGLACKRVYGWADRRGGGGKSNHDAPSSKTAIPVLDSSIGR